MANAKHLIEQRLRGASSAMPTPAPLSGRADPNGISGASEYLRGVARPDRSTLAPNGNRAYDLDAIATRKRLDFSRRDAANPLGASLAGGFYV